MSTLSLTKASTNSRYDGVLLLPCNARQRVILQFPFGNTVSVPDPSPCTDYFQYHMWKPEGRVMTLITFSLISYCDCQYCNI